MSSKLTGMTVAAIVAFLPAALWLRPVMGQTAYTLVSTTSYILWSDTTSWTGGEGGLPRVGDSVLVNAGAATLSVNANRSVRYFSDEKALQPDRGNFNTGEVPF